MIGSHCTLDRVFHSQSVGWSMLCTPSEKGSQRKKNGNSSEILKRTLGRNLKSAEYDQILDIHFFLHFRTQWVFPRYLGKFQSIMKTKLLVFWTFINFFYFSLFQVSMKIGEMPSIHIHSFLIFKQSHHKFLWVIS